MATYSWKSPKWRIWLRKYGALTPFRHFSSASVFNVVEHSMSSLIGIWAMLWLFLSILRHCHISFSLAGTMPGCLTGHRWGIWQVAQLWESWTWPQALMGEDRACRQECTTSCYSRAADTSLHGRAGAAPADVSPSVTGRSKSAHLTRNLCFSYLGHLLRLWVIFFKLILKIHFLC